MPASGSRRPRRPITRADRAAIVVGALTAAAGAILLALASSTTVSVIGACLLGVAGVAFVSLVFLLVGESEDRDYGGDAP
jgi:MFS family permease